MSPVSDRGPSRLRLLPVLLLAVGLLPACSPERFLIVESDPPGASVRLDDELIGRTPLEVPFQFYGKRRLTLYLDGYRTVSQSLDLNEPWHATFPIDVVTEVLIPLGLTYRKEVFVQLEEDVAQAEDIDPTEVIGRARAVRETVRRPEPRRKRRPPATAEDTETPDTPPDEEGSSTGGGGEAAQPDGPDGEVSGGTDPRFDP